ncbi:MAG: Gfo/Idh/MocA family oxidoreductase [Armatimonadota bacterium]
MTLRIAIIGTGKVARDNYIPYLAGQPDVTLAYYNRTESTAHEIAMAFGGEVLPSLEAVADWEPTTALVLTSETARFDTGMALIEAGARRLFFEKPLTAAQGQAHVTEDDFHKGKEMLTRAAQRGCETAMVFNYRFFEQTQSAKRIAVERNFGPLIQAAGLVHYACWSHCIDLLQHFGGPVAEITALSGTIQHQGPAVKIDATDVTAALRLENGAVATLIGTAGMPWQHPLFELLFSFRSGRIHLRDLDGTLEILNGESQIRETQSITRHTSRWDQYKDSFRKSLDAYLESLRGDLPPPVPGLDGLRELQVEAALKRSIAQRRPVLVQEEFPLN